MNSGLFPESRLSASSLEDSNILLRRARQGDLEARDRIMARYASKLMRWASGRLPASARSLADASDLVQDAILKTICNLPHLEIPAQGGLLPYLRTAMRNLIRDHCRNASRRGERTALDDALPDPRPSPLERAVGNDALERYEAALSRLRPEEQQAILLRVKLDCSWGLVAKELGKPSADAARVAVCRTLLRLAEEMSHGDLSR